MEELKRKIQEKKNGEIMFLSLSRKVLFFIFEMLKRISTGIAIERRMHFKNRDST